MVSGLAGLLPAEIGCSVIREPWERPCGEREDLPRDGPSPCQHLNCTLERARTSQLSCSQILDPQKL